MVRVLSSPNLGARTLPGLHPTDDENQDSPRDLSPPRFGPPRVDPKYNKIKKKPPVWKQAPIDIAPLQHYLDKSNVGFSPTLESRVLSDRQKKVITRVKGRAAEVIALTSEQNVCR